MLFTIGYLYLRKTAFSPWYDEKMKKPKFSKRHYCAIAEIVRNSKTKNQIVENLVFLFSKDNPRFSQKKFSKAIETP